MKRFLSSIFLLCGVVLAAAAAPVCGQSGAAVNKKALKDFEDYVKTKNIDWKKPFTVEAETVLTKDGKFDGDKTKFTKTEGDAETTEAVKRAFEAMGESGWFGYLRNQGMEEIRISASQTDDLFAVLIVSEQTTPARANSVTSGMNNLVKTALLASKYGWKKFDDDEKRLLKATKVTSQEKTVTMNISLAAGDFQEMMRRRMSAEKEVKTAK